MVKCSNCGLDVKKDLKNCPNCGNALIESEDSIQDIKNETLICSNCGEELNENNSFCPSCGDKVEKDHSNLKCWNCGSELSENTLFCSVCGTKVENIKNNAVKTTKTCPNCGFEVDDDTTFCENCGTNITDGVMNKQEIISQNPFLEKINLNTIIKPSIIALVVAIVLSLFGLLIGFSWFSFIIAIILSAGFFAGTIDNEANAIVFGLIVGLLLGLLENPLVELIFGAFVGGFYDWFYGGHLILIVILGVIVAYASNMYFKENILKIIGNFREIL